MKKQIIIGVAALLTIAANAQAKVSAVKYASGAATITLDRKAFVEITPNGSRLYCVKGSPLTTCTSEARVIAQAESEDEGCDTDTDCCEKHPDICKQEIAEHEADLVEGRQR